MILLDDDEEDQFSFDDYLLASRSMLINMLVDTLIKKKINFSSYIGKFRVELLQSHILGRASKYMRKCANISPNMKRSLVIYDFPTAPF